MPLRRLRWNEPGLGFFAEALYRACRFSVEVVCTFLYRLRVTGAHRVPRSGGLLVIANHASHLDPPLVGVALRYRAMRSIARSGLFQFPLFARLISTLGAIPIGENQGDMSAVRLAIDQIERGRVVVIFPEGSRSANGELGTFKRGSWLIISRAKCDVLPMAVVGAYEIWPRTRSFPRLSPPRDVGSVGVLVGEVVPYRDLESLSADEGLSLLKGKVAALQNELRAQLAAPHRNAAWGI